MTSSNGNIFRVTGPLWGEPPTTGGFPSQRPAVDVFFYQRLNKRLSKQSRPRWFETPSRSVWRHCNVYLHLSHFSTLKCRRLLWFALNENKNISISHHYNDVIMGAIASEITSLTIVYSIVCSDAYQSKHQSSASQAVVRGIHRSSPGTGEFPAQMASNAEDVPIWWRHHVTSIISADVLATQGVRTSLTVTTKIAPRVSGLWP